MMRPFKVYFLSFLVIFILLSTTTAFGSDPGDINNDGAVNLADGVLPLPILSGQSTDGLNIDISADVNGDGRITFSNAKVIDYKEGLVAYPRLLNDPMGDDNNGLDPDEDILGSLTDWNDDEHNCPDYPTKCNDWDDEDEEYGCGEDGVDPPSDPGV